MEKPWGHRINIVSATVLAFVFIIICASNVAAEFYKYVDKNGVAHFVDDLGQIPENYLPEVDRLNDRYDGLSQEEKDSVIEQELLKERALDQEYRKAAENLRIQQERFRLQDLEQERKRLEKKMKTPVRIKGNRVIVPVRITHGRRTRNVQLLLDTGATNIFIYRKALGDEDIIKLTRKKVVVAGGGKIDSFVTKLDNISVGPFKMKNRHVIVIENTRKDSSIDGMLGMSFLKHVGYEIDFADESITWKLDD